MSNRSLRKKGRTCSETRSVWERVGTKEKRISNSVSSKVCETAHTGQIGVASENDACIPAAKDSAGGQTCAPCNASARHTTLTSASTKALQRENCRLETITILSQSDAASI